MKEKYNLDIPITAGMWGGSYLVALDDGEAKTNVVRLYSIVNLPQNSPLDEKDNFEYFDSEANSAKKALMRTPLDGARISSVFGKRKHPILGYTKMHKGVDFAAPRNTPVFAAGDGSIEHAKRNGGYGKFILIRHNSDYKTAYAHLAGFAKNIREGKRVKQGDIIGYVGTTGRSTGPHLHYEIIFRNKQVNPLKVRMPKELKLNNQDYDSFIIERNRLDNIWDSL